MIRRAPRSRVASAPWYWNWPPLLRDWKNIACASPRLLPWTACTGNPAASAGLMVCAPIRSPQWMTASAPCSRAAATAWARASARSWLSETMQIFTPALLGLRQAPFNRTALSAHQEYRACHCGSRQCSMHSMPLVSPHGGKGLKPLLLQGAEAGAEMKRAQSLPRLTVSSREKGDLVMLGLGGFSPLPGFMGR